MSQRNVVKGTGWAQRGSIKSIPVCRVCDEIMAGAQVGVTSWEDIGRSAKKRIKLQPVDLILNLLIFILNLLVYAKFLLIPVLLALIIRWFVYVRKFPIEYRKQFLIVPIVAYISSAVLFGLLFALFMV
jgi:hypothetical protein